MNRDFNTEAAALPHHRFDLLMHGFMWRTFERWIDGVSALELGCFHGEMTGRIFKAYPETTVVEGAAECITIAKRKWPLVEFHHSNFEGIHLERKFDAVFLIHTLEHVQDPVALLRRCREWLEPGGKLFLAVPNAHAASRQLAVLMGLIEFEEAVTEAEARHGHHRTYGMDSLLLDVLRAGLTAVEHGGILYKPLANFQMDRALDAGVIDVRYMDACYALGKKYPEQCASIYAVCQREERAK